MGKGSKPTVGYWYHLAFHHGLTIGPIDAFLEMRGGDKTAWQGELTASGTISINAPNLWGGEKDQGGIVGDVDVMFGEPTQVPNAYLVSTFGNQTAAWCGFSTVVFKGGRYGAMNPYPQAASYKFRQILQGWDDTCWYPEKAAITLDTGNLLSTDIAFPGTSAGIDPAINGVTFNSGFTETDVLMVLHTTGMTYQAWGRWNTTPPPGRKNWTNEFWVKTEDGVVTDYWNGEYDTADEAEAAVLNQVVYLTGNTSYTIGLKDNPVSDNVGGLSLRVFKNGMGELVGINPAHLLYYSRTNGDMGREPTANINDASLQAAADKLYAEGFGICPKWDPSSESVEDFEQRICKLIGGSFNRSLEDGLWYLDLARGDYVLDDLPILTDDDILDFKEQPTVLDNAINSVSVSYFDVQAKETIVTAPTRALGLVASFGTVHQTNDYPEIPAASLAALIALRDLLTTATPTRAFDLVTTRKTYAWRPNQYYRLQSSKRGIADMVCIVGQVQSGTLKSGAIKLSASQDIYSLPTASFVQVEPGVDTRPSQTPTPITLQNVMEAPYINVSTSLSRADLAALPDDVGFVAAMAVTSANDLNYTMMVSAAGGAYTDNGQGDWCATATVNEAAAYLDTAFTLAAGVLLGSVEVGTAAVWDQELVRVDAIDVGAGTITLGRGCADTVPAAHAANSRLWFYAVAYAYDATEYTVGEAIDVKLLSNTGSQQAPLANATTMPLTFAQRQVKPYPPGKLTLNDKLYPTIVYGPDITVAFAHRDRIIQADQLVDTTAADVGPEAGTTYTLRGYINSTLDHTATGEAGSPIVWTPSGSGTARVEIDAVRDSLVSWQSLSADFTFEVSGDLTISGTFGAATIGVSYTSDLPISGGDGTYSNQRVTVGTLPTWGTLSIVGTVGSYKLRLSGTPTGSATTVDITVAVDSGDGQTATSAQSIMVAQAAWYAPLFANGEQGMVVDFNDLTSLFQDTSHTVPVTAAGDPIKSAKCKITGAFGIVNSGSATCAYDATNGLYYAQGNGTFNLGFAGAVPSSFAGNGVASVIAVNSYVNTAQTTGCFIGPAFPTSGSSGNALAFAQVNDGGWKLEFLQYGAGHGVSTPALSGVHVCIGLKNPTTATLAIYVDGALKATNSPITAGVISTMNLDIGRETTAQKYYSAVIINRLLTSTEITNVSAGAL